MYTTPVDEAGEPTRTSRDSFQTEEVTVCRYVYFATDVFVSVDSQLDVVTDQSAH